MGNNRFLGVKTLGDLYTVFCNQDVADYSALTADELDRIADVFEANIPDKVDMPDRPLTEAGYTLIWNVTVDTIEAFINNSIDKEVEKETNNEEKAEEKEMAGTVTAAVEEMMGKFAEAKENIKVNVGQTREEYFEVVDDSLNVVNGAFGSALGVLDEFFGFTALKTDILDIYHAGERADGKKDIFKMAKKCRERIDEEIETINELSDLGLMDEEESIKMKDVLEELKGCNIFKKFATMLVFFIKKVTRKLRKWLQVNEEKSVIGAICRSVAGVAEVLKAGLKIVWNTAKFAVSFIVAGIMLVAAPIINAIKTLVVKIKGWFEDKFKKPEAEEVDFEEVEEVEIEEEIEEEFEEE